MKQNQKRIRCKQNRNKNERGRESLTGGESCTAAATEVTPAGIDGGGFVRPHAVAVRFGFATTKEISFSFLCFDFFSALASPCFGFLFFVLFDSIYGWLLVIEYDK
jgi:hypothetical protein